MSGYFKTEGMFKYVFTEENEISKHYLDIPIPAWAQ